MNRVVVGVFVIGVVAGCSFSHNFRDYCATSGKCVCSEDLARPCCVNAGNECSVDLGCCNGLVCDNTNHCTDGGLGGGSGGGLGGGTGGGGGGGSATDAGSLRDVMLVVIDAGTTISSGLDLSQFKYLDGGMPPLLCGGGLIPTRMHADGGITEETCCSTSVQPGLCVGATTCTQPGSLNTAGRSCCWSDLDTPESPDDQDMVCPWNVTMPIDGLMEPVHVNELPPGAFCADGGLKALGGCCSPDTNFTTCSFGTVSCSLELTGSPCCLVAFFPAGTPNPPELLNDCRANGACDCRPDGGCSNNAGAICVDLIR